MAEKGLTAAGLHGIFTRFPNPLRREVTPFFANGQHSRSKKRCSERCTSCLCARSRGPKVPCQSGESIPETAVSLVLVSPDGVAVSTTLVGVLYVASACIGDNHTTGNHTLGMQNNHFCGRAYIRFLHDKTLCLESELFYQHFFSVDDIEALAGFGNAASAEVIDDLVVSVHLDAFHTSGLTAEVED